MRVPVSFSVSWFITSHPTGRARIRISQHCILRPNPRFGPQCYFQLPNIPEFHQTSIPNSSPPEGSAPAVATGIWTTPPLLLSLIADPELGLSSSFSSHSLSHSSLFLWLCGSYPSLGSYRLRADHPISLWSLLPSVQLSPVPWTSL